MRPKTLSEVANRTFGGHSFDRSFADFLDEFYRIPNPGALLDSPPLLAPAFGELGRVQDAYLAAAAEELARSQKMPIPEWADAEERKLHRPSFASPLVSLRAILLLESPVGFRSRNLFVSQNALARA